MGQRCCHSTFQENLPTAIRVSVDDSTEETLGLVPETLETLMQSVIPFAARHMPIEKDEYLILTHIRSPTLSVHLSRQKDFKLALKHSSNKEMRIRISKASYSASLDLHVQTSGDASVDSFLQSFGRNLAQFRSEFSDFSMSLKKLLLFASNLSLFTLHPSIESAVTALLVTFISEDEGSSKAVGLRVTAGKPFIHLVAANLTQVSIGVYRLWNDFVQSISKIKSIVDTLRGDFCRVSRLVSEAETAGKEGKHTIGVSPEQVIRAQQCFEEVCLQYEATESQLFKLFSHFQEAKSQVVLCRLARIKASAKTQGLMSTLAIYNLKGSPKYLSHRLMEEIALAEEDDLCVD